MWKAIAAVVNRFVTQAYEEAATETAATAKTAPAVSGAAISGTLAPVDREYLEQQFQRAIQLMQGGNPPGAQQMMRAAVARIAQQQPGTPLFAEALIKEATILTATGELARAEIACRAAIDLPLDDDAARKERINHQTFLGDLLARQAKFDEAERVLRDALAARQQLYGAEHTGSAVGLAALADLLLQRGRADEALVNIDEAVRLLSRAKHERLPTDLALRAFTVKAAKGPDAESLTAWPDISRGMQKTLIQQCVRHAKQADAKLAQPVLTELRDRAHATAEMDAPLLLSIDIALANVAQQNGDHAARIAACESMVKLCQSIADHHQLAAAQQALAMAFDDAGRAEEAAAAYEAAVKTARDVNDLALLSTVLMNYGNSADKAGRSEQADQLHREAVDHGASSGDWSTHGRSTVAYGIFLQHNGRLEEAKGLLEEAVAHLPPSHGDFAAAQEHLAALDGGHKCACRIANAK